MTCPHPNFFWIFSILIVSYGCCIHLRMRLDTSSVIVAGVIGGSGPSTSYPLNLATLEWSIPSLFPSSSCPQFVPCDPQFLRGFHCSFGRSADSLSFLMPRRLKALHSNFPAKPLPPTSMDMRWVRHQCLQHSSASLVYFPLFRLSAFSIPSSQGTVSSRMTTCFGEFYTSTVSGLKVVNR